MPFIRVRSCTRRSFCGSSRSGSSWSRRPRRQAGHDVRLIDLQVETHRDYLEATRRLAAGRRRLLLQLPRERPGDRRPGQDHRRASFPDCFVFVGGHSASFIAARAPRARRGRHRLRAEGRGRSDGRRLLLGRRARPQRARQGPGRGHAGRRRAAAALRREPRRPPAGARSAAPPPQVFHRRARPLRVDRVLPRLPVGLLVLQRLDLLRAQLSDGQPGAGRRGARERSASPASSSSTTSRSSRRSTASRSARRSPGAASRSSTTWRRAATCCCATRRCSASGSGSGSRYMFLGLEAIDEEGLKMHRKRVSLGKNFEALEFARSLGINGRDQHHRRPRLGPRRVSRSSASGAWRSRRSSTSASTRPIPAPRAGSPRRAGFTTRDYRLFDIQHAVLPTRLPLPEFYEELVQHPAGAEQEASGLDAAAGRRPRSRPVTCCAARRTS